MILKWNVVYVLIKSWRVNSMRVWQIGIVVRDSGKEHLKIDEIEAQVKLDVLVDCTA
jgi:hypothetical protein